MAGLSDLLTISGSGLKTYQKQIHVTSQNISNVNTDGYSRRYLEQGTALPQDGFGSGVKTGDVIRAYNSIGAAHLLREDSVATYHSDLAAELSTLEMLSGGSSGGIYTALQDFEVAWQQVAATPEDLSARTMLLQKGASLADQFNTLATRFDEYTSGIAAGTTPITGSSADAVTDVNNITTKLQALNKEISQTELMGHTVPDLLDERDSLVRNLSQLINISITPDYRITAGGQELVAADGSARQALDQTAAATFSVGGVDISSSISGGKIAALTSARTTALNMRSDLDTLAASIASELNTVFDASYNFSGQTPSSQGYTLFTGTTADTLALDRTIYDPSDPMGARPELIAAATTVASAGPPPIPNRGDNSAAQAMVDIFNGSVASLGGATMSDYWLRAQTDLATIAHEEEAYAQNSSLIVQMLDNRMQEESGVNLDEELMGLMSSQRAYEACAKLMSTANGLLDTLLGVV